MKVFLCCTIFLVCALAEVKVIYEFPEWWEERDFDKSEVIAVKSRAARIFGGEEATPNRLPYQVGLLLFLKNSIDVGFCSGSLLTTTRVVTAAHCLDIVAGLQAIFGAHLIDRKENSQTRMSVQLSNLVWHANYSSKTLKNDIALVNLPTPVTLSSVVKVINLPTGDDLTRDFVGEKVRISGWGRFSSSEVLSKHLRFVDVSVITNAVCRKYFPTKLQESNICTSGMQENDLRAGTCSSDSGGPMTIEIDGVVTLIGIASFVSGKGCDEGYPSSFTRISSFITWINERLTEPEVRRLRGWPIRRRSNAPTRQPIKGSTKGYTYRRKLPASNYRG